jgi:hypothetical protein
MTSNDLELFDNVFDFCHDFVVHVRSSFGGWQKIVIRPPNAIINLLYHAFKGVKSPLIHHQGIISPPGRDFASSSGVAFPPEAGKRSLLSFDLEAFRPRALRS